MKKTLIFALLGLTCLPVLSQSKEMVAGNISSSEVSADNREINNYLADLTDEDAALGSVMTDVVKIKRERCDLNMGILDIKLISTKDDVFKELEEKVKENPAYIKSFEYSGRVKSHFGKCG
ncbi:hypothetical protein ACX9Q3_002023 [Klebsiella oxytoca]|uniref:hypothetical protein n=1 Tax=Enterobacterales TaxID=91347 RepID=UPI0009B9CBBB|nr:MULTISPECIES: hypothetical protein [Enterobacteriaceae]HBR1132614.1 hypothetical protein [Klebsiella quasipneumoniae subsp. similipneumoniae]HCM5085301.1 hypothetical protein [Klebsiella aerogenes]HED2943983.1 hypothetical protein [Enterobacter hormaechei subsp. xiangfangensis]EKV6709785.1 hypothetical protein [Klebsiella pneumoniae]ELA1511728.1 hypothetical protein [Klebsiella pneumoniae]